MSKTRHTLSEKERHEFVDAIRKDIKWRGISYDTEYFASDNIAQMYAYAERLIEKGKAYVCACTKEEIKDQRMRCVGCKHRRQGHARNMELWREMFTPADGAGEGMILRLSGDMKSDNTTMRDPTLFRVKTDAHYRQGSAYRVGDLKNKIPIKADTIFCIGSIGKSFIAEVTMMLVEKGKINLNDSLTKYFPDAPKSWKKIKIKNMLSHTSGLADYEDDFAGPNGPFYPNEDYSEDVLVKKTTKLPIMFKPGQKYAYCNTNYMLLGIIIRKITGKFWFDYLQEKIFKPLNMNSVQLVLNKDLKKSIPSAYNLKNNILKKNVRWSDTFNSTADGCSWCNLYDLAKFDKDLYDTKLLKQSNLNKMWNVFKLNNGKPNSGKYGFGWFIIKVNGHKIIEHGGAWEGFGTYIARYVDDEMTIVVLENRDGSDKTGVHAHIIAGLLNPKLKL